MSNSPIIQGLLSSNPELATAVQPQPPLAAAQAPNPNAPRVPAPQVPMAPASAPQDDDNDVPDVPTHPIDDMASAFMDHLIKKDSGAYLGKDTSQPAPPGSFGEKLSGAMKAVAGGLGDAQAGSNAKGGWLGAVGATLNARTNRLKEEEAAAFEKSERLKNDQLNLARTNIAMRQEALAMQKQEKEVRDSSASQGAAFINDLRDNYKVTDGITQSKLQEMVNNKKDYLNTHTARITGYKPVLDNDGNPKVVDGVQVEEPLWSIVDLAPGDMSKQFKVTPQMSKRWSDAGLTTVTPGTVMPVTAAAQMDSRAQRYSSTLNILDHARLEPLSNDVKDALSDTLQNEEVQHAIASKPGSPLDGLYQAKANIKQHIDQLQQNIGKAQGPGAADAIKQQMQKYQDIDSNLDKAINMGFTDKERTDYQKAKDEDRRETEKIRHDQREEEIQAARAAALAKKEQTNKELADSYKVENKEFDLVRKPLSTQLDAFSTLRASLDQGTAAGDSIVAPALLKALVAGGGVRITQAEIAQFTHGRSSVEDLKATLQKMSSGKSITDEQRRQVYSLLGAVEEKAARKNNLLLDAQDKLDSADTILSQRGVVNDLRRQLDTIDGVGRATPSITPKPASAPKLPAGAKSFNNGAVYELGGKYFNSADNSPYVPPTAK